MPLDDEDRPLDDELAAPLEEELDPLTMEDAGGTITDDKLALDEMADELLDRPTADELDTPLEEDEEEPTSTALLDDDDEPASTALLEDDDRPDEDDDALDEDEDDEELTSSDPAQSQGHSSAPAAATRVASE